MQKDSALSLFSGGLPTTALSFTSSKAIFTMTTHTPGMISLRIRARPLLKSHAPAIATHLPPLRRLLSSTQIRMSTIASAATSSTVEHIVLFNVKEGTNDSQLSAMLNGLNGLRSLDRVQYITAGPVHRNRSTSLKFTHMLHSRYGSKDDLAAYSAHPAHMDVVKSSVLPICEDIMAVDWVAQIPETGSGLKSGSAMRVQFIKLKEGLGETEKGKVLEVVGGLKEKINGIEQLSFGENFSPARAKGFSIASIGVFPGLTELDAADQTEEIAKEKDKVRDYIDSLVIVDYVVPSAQSASL